MELQLKHKSQGTIGKGEITANKITYNNKEAKVDSNGKITTINNGSKAASNQTAAETVNQNITNNETEKETYTSRKLNTDVTIDNRLLTSNGRKEIIEELQKTSDTLKLPLIYNNLKLYLPTKTQKALREAIKNYKDAINKYVGTIEELDEANSWSLVPTERVEKLKELSEHAEHLVNNKNKLLKTFVNAKDDLENQLKNTTSMAKKEDIIQILNNAKETIETLRAQGAFYHNEKNEGTKETYGDYKALVNKDNVSNIKNIATEAASYFNTKIELSDKGKNN